MRSNCHEICEDLLGQICRLAQLEKKWTEKKNKTNCLHSSTWLLRPSLRILNLMKRTHAEFCLLAIVFIRFRQLEKWALDITRKNYGHPALRIANYFWTTYEICTRTWGLALREPILTKMNALRHFPTAAADRDK